MQLKSFIEKHTDIKNSEWETILPFFQKKEFRKNEHILEQGQICRYFYFLEKGLVRFYTNLDGNDVTNSFVMAPYCFTSKMSFGKHAASHEGIQALDKTIVWQISLENYKKLEGVHSWNIFIKKLLNEIQVFSEANYLEIRTMTAKERYEKILQQYPLEWVDKIPLKHLSSYLGIAPQSLSRIRKSQQDFSN